MTPYQLNQVHRGQGNRLVIGPYLLLERLGRGGMRDVFKARHRRLGRITALKLIRAARLGTPRAARRFLREVQAAGRLDHPNVVHAYDAAQEGETLYLAMEYVQGWDLDKLVRLRGPLDMALACDSVRQAALGLQHAFERGIVHRDVKPSNLLLCSRTSTVMVLDLGLALVEQVGGTKGSQLTRAGRVLGTVDYLAPEQAFDSRAADTRSDLYALGCTFYYLLTGQPPFPKGSPIEKVMKHVGSQPEPVEAVRRDVPPEVAAVVRKLLAKQPEDRYQTPAELAEALQEVLKGLSAQTPVACEPCDSNSVNPTLPADDVSRDAASHPSTSGGTHSVSTG